MEINQSKYKLSLDQIIQAVPKLTLDPNKHEVNEIPKGINIHFIDSKYMNEFEAYSKKKSKVVKFVNYARPAINLSFYQKHKYKLDKEPQPTEVYEMLLKRVDELKEFITQESLFQEADLFERKSEARQQLANIQLTLNNFKKYQFAVSNYYRKYIYMYVSYRYRTEEENLDFSSEHLLNSERDKFGNLFIQKQNIIFIDMDYIGVHTPYQNKKIEDFLNAFDKRLDVGFKDIFVKEKKE